MKSTLTCLTFAALLLGMFVGCETAPKTAAEKGSLEYDAKLTVARFKDTDPSMDPRFENAYGYAVFPRVAKGGAIVGGAHGRGVLYEKGRMVGYCDLTQGTFGLQLGGQSYSELIFFKDKLAVEEFKRGDFALAAQASAVAAKAGASADADYEHGVIVFTMVRGGLMAEASVGGQQFTYEAKK